MAGNIVLPSTHVDNIKLCINVIISAMQIIDFETERVNTYNKYRPPELVEVKLTLGHAYDMLRFYNSKEIPYPYTLNTSDTYIQSCEGILKEFVQRVGPGQWFHDKMLQQYRAQHLALNAVVPQHAVCYTPRTPPQQLETPPSTMSEDETTYEQLKDIYITPAGEKVIPILPHPIQHNELPPQSCTPTNDEPRAQSAQSYFQIPRLRVINTTTRQKNVKRRKRNCKQ
ncbi:MAG: hypothetical protein PHN45_00860 [Methylococcales bacterium]|nr:hypothetical protein [Methylococcales bacterium]